MLDRLMNKLKTALIESREDQNEESIRTALQPKSKQIAHPKDAVAAEPKVPKAEQKNNRYDDSKGLPSPTIKPKPKAKAKSPNEGTKGAGKGKGEEKGKDKSKEKKGAD